MASEVLCLPRLGPLPVVAAWILEQLHGRSGLAGCKEVVKGESSSDRAFLCILGWVLLRPGMRSAFQHNW
jgi:hypothetical protein